MTRKTKDAVDEAELEQVASLPTEPPPPPPLEPGQKAYEAFRACFNGTVDGKQNGTAIPYWGEINTDEHARWARIEELTRS